MSFIQPSHVIDWSHVIHSSHSFTHPLITYHSLIQWSHVIDWSHVIHSSHSFTHPLISCPSLMQWSHVIHWSHAIESSHSFTHPLITCHSLIHVIHSSHVIHWRHAIHCSHAIHCPMMWNDESDEKHAKKWKIHQQMCERNRRALSTENTHITEETARPEDAPGVKNTPKTWTNMPKRWTKGGKNRSGNDVKHMSESFPKLLESPGNPLSK